LLHLNILLHLLLPGDRRKVVRLWGAALLGKYFQFHSYIYFYLSIVIYLSISYHQSIGGTGAWIQGLIRQVPQSFLLLLLFFLLLSCWGYIVTFSKVLTMYQIYHSWIQPLYHSPLSPLTLFLEYFQQVSLFHLHTCVHSIRTIFTLLYPFPTSSPLPLVPTPRQDLFCPSVHRFCKNKKRHFCLFK
jgi:hypothetical protein